MCFSQVQPTSTDIQKTHAGNKCAGQIDFTTPQSVRHYIYVNVMKNVCLA